MKNRIVITYAGGGGPAEPVLSKQSVLADAVKSNVKDGAPAPVRVSETGRARNWTMPPLRLERECKEHSAEQNDLLSFCERRNSATIDNRCVEFDRRENQRCAFTMAEILLSLTIIGVVAAITLPSLTGNINERTWNTQRKALYARFSQAIALMPSLNGYGTLVEVTDSSGSNVLTEDNVAETFITGALSKVLKINNVCDNQHLEDCGIPSKITTLDAENKLMPKTMAELNSRITSLPATSIYPAQSGYNTKSAAFETQNGESINLFYNPNCVSNMNETSNYRTQPKVCLNMIFDLNGTKGPNTVGKDIGFMTVLYPTDSVVVAPVPHLHDATSGVEQSKATATCTHQNSEYRMPNREEYISLFVNQELIGIDSGLYWTSTLDAANVNMAWIMSFTTGGVGLYSRTNEYPVRCVKR